MKKAKTPNMAALSIAAIAFTVPLIAVPASGALNTDSFFVHAHNTEDPAIESTAGRFSPEGSSGETTPGEDTSRVLKSFSCGPMSVKITQDMVDLDIANRALMAAGRSDEVKFHAAGGWATMLTYDSDLTEHAGYPETVDPVAVIFTKTDGFKTSADMTAMFDTSTPGECSAEDRSTPFQAGKRYKYQLSSATGNYEDSRYAMEDGKLVAVQMRQTSTELSLTRWDTEGIEKGVVGMRGTAKSSKYPSQISWRTDGSITALVELPSSVDGYDVIDMSREADGSGVLYYKRVNSTTGDREIVNRTSGPAIVAWDSSGSISRVSYMDSSGVAQHIPSGPNLLSEFKSKTGIDWDGSYHNLDDFDTRKPFEPVAPQ